MDRIEPDVNAAAACAPNGTARSGWRRRDAAGLVLGAGLSVAAPFALAQAKKAAPAKAFVEGENYIRLEQPVPVSGKPFEVVEFFWYECPHCNAFEPALEAWEQTLRADTVLRRVPVYFAEVPFAAQQRLFYALEATGQLKALHRKVYRTIHVERRRMRTPEDFRAFITANGGDVDAFMAALASPAVANAAADARRLAAAYRIDAVPAMGINGRWYTNGGLANANGPAGSNARMLDVVETLLARLRTGKT